MSPGAATTDDPGASRGGSRRWLKRGCGCGALLFGALVALVLLLPGLAGGQLASIVERGFGEQYQGSLELDELDLAWTSRQRVEGARLRDPEGGDVARAAVELPSILDLARSASSYGGDERTELGRVEIDFDANVVYGADGRSNFQRALAPRAPASPGDEGGAPPEGRELPDLRDLYDRLGLSIVLRPSSVVLQHPLLGEGAAPIRLLGLEGGLELTPGAPVRLELRGMHDFGQPGPLTLTASASDPVSGEKGIELGTLVLALELDAIPYAALAERFGEPELATDLQALLGSRLALNAELGSASAAGAQRLQLGFETVGLRGEAHGTYVDGTLASSPGEAFGTLGGRLPGALLDGLVRRYLPEGAAIETPPEGAELALTLNELSLPVKAEDRLDAARVAASLSLGPITYNAPALAERGTPLVMREAKLDLETRPESGASLALSTALDGEGEPRLAVSASLAPGWRRALEERRFGALGLDASASAQAFPTSVIDALAGQDGLLTDVLGPSLALELGVEGVSEAGGRLVAGFDSKLGAIDWRATYRDGALRATAPDDQFSARVQLSPLLAERIVGPLLPVLVDLQKPAGAAPVELSTRDFVLPLDGDLDRLTATLGLSLGEISYRLLPGLSELLPKETALTQRTTTLPAYTVKLGGGVARYEELPLVIDGKRFDTKGSFDLKQKRFDFDLELPLANLGGEVAQGLDALRGILPSDLVVPVHLGGTLTKPKLSIDGAFVEQAAKDAARNALQKELEKGVGGELQKKLDELLKKKKDG